MSAQSDVQPTEVPAKTPLPKYEYPPETKQQCECVRPLVEEIRSDKLTISEVKYADLVTIDLSQFDLPGGQEKLAQQLKDAVREVGKFAIL